MAVSNKFGCIFLNTSNKSEAAVDMEHFTEIWPEGFQLSEMFIKQMFTSLQNILTETGDHS